jgi:ankyrin repeat protein
MVVPRIRHCHTFFVGSHRSRRIVVNLRSVFSDLSSPSHFSDTVTMTEQEYLRAAFDGNLEQLRAYVSAGGNIDVTNRHGMSALMLAIWNGRDRSIVEYLIDIGTDLGIRQPSSDWRALTFAAVNGHAELLALLFARGDRLADDDADWKSLMFAVQYRSSATAEILLAHGARVDPRDDDGRTPLMRAVRNSDDASLGLLLRHGANPRAVDDDGNTALHHAAAKANLTNIRMLVEHGADPAATNVAGETAIDIARAKKKSKVVAALEALAGVS